MPRFKDQAICIRLIDWSETSQIVALLTEEHGTLRGLAKGAKRTSPSSVARYSGGIELLTLGQAVGMIRPSAELANITEWDLQQGYWHLRQDLNAQRTALYAADLAGALVSELDPHPRAFAALGILLETLAQPQQGAAALLQFQWDLLADCGYRPELDQDTISGEPLARCRSYRFDAKAGGLTSQQHVGQVDPDARPPTAWGVRWQTVQLLRGVAQGNRVKSDADTIQRANRLLCVYVRTILDRQLPTMGFVLGKESN